MSGTRVHIVETGGASTTAVREALTQIGCEVGDQEGASLAILVAVGDETSLARSCRSLEKSGLSVIAILDRPGDPSALIAAGCDDVLSSDRSVEVLVERIGVAIHRAERQSRQRVDLERLRAILRALPDLLIRLDQGAVFREIQTSDPTILVAPPQELMGRSIFDFLPEAVAKKGLDAITRALETGTLQSIEYDLPFPDGQKYFEARMVPCGRDEVILLIRDFTERHENRQALISARDQALGSTRAKSQFLARISHEIRTPLTAILGVVELLEEDMDGGSRRLVDLLVGNTKKLLDVVDALLDFSTIDAGRLVLRNEPVAVAAIAQSVIDRVRPDAEQRNLDLSLGVDSTVPSSLIGDPLRFDQVLTNLLSNAVKFTREGRVAARVEVQSEDTESVVILVIVTDTGIGIPEDALDEIFSPFVRVQGEPSRRYRGTGLGLAICRELALLMGGDITVQSEIDQGATFSFTARLRRRLTS